MESDEDLEDLENIIMENQFDSNIINILRNLNIKKEINNVMDYFQKIEIGELSSSKNEFNLIKNETKSVYTFLDNSIKNFHKLFNANLKDFEDCLKYLEKNAIPNKCVCAAVIDNIPGWRCIDCSKYENSIYCNDCYKKSKNFHKNHKVFYLYSSSGMCDCGDPDSLTTFCPEHIGPHSNQKKIDENISKKFKKEVLINLNKFFKNLFSIFSKYFVLTEKCKYFSKELFDNKFNNNSDKNLNKEKKDLILLKSNFCIVFQNLLHFLRLISKSNISMLHLIAKYFLNNYFDNIKIEDKYMTNHRCLKILEEDIKILKEGTNHVCKCPFFRLFISNYRDDIRSIQNENEEFLISFSHNLSLRSAYCIIFFAIYKQVLLNNNEDIINNRNQYFLEDVTYLIGKKTKLIEESYDILYQYIFNNIKSSNLVTNSGAFNSFLIDKLNIPVLMVYNDTNYFSKPQMKQIMTEKTSIMKKIIDIICLFHNQNKFESIVPHPQFQARGFSSSLVEFEIYLLGIVERIIIYLDWNKIEPLKEICKYLVNKILNQKNEGIEQLKENEYSFHLCLYRCFGLLMNSFCLNYAFINNKSKCKLLDSINYFKNICFESQNQVEEFVGKLLKDYCKLFGFISGIKNNFFNYYEKLEAYSNLYFLIKTPYLMDFSLLKYLFVMSNNTFDIILFFKLSNIENTYSNLEKSFDIKKIQNKNISEEELANNSMIEQSFEIKQKQNKNDSNKINGSNDNKKVIKFELVDYKGQDEYNCIMQWSLLLEILIGFMKDDSCIYWNLMKSYEEVVSSKTKRDLFNIVRKNKNAMKDLENILKEKLIHEIISQGNLTDLKTISKNFDKYLEILFEEDHKFNKALDELTENKMNEETKIFYLKDIYLKYLDFNYYFSKQDKSNAQRYILDFKKDLIKPYNSYYYNPSELTFEFYEIVYEKILLNKKNLQLITNIIEKLLSNEKITENLDMKSVRNSLLPITLNYLSMFAVINTKSFIEFKNQNKILIDNLYEKLLSSLENNKNNNMLEKDLEDNIKGVLNQLNRYQIISDSLNGDLSKLDKYNYNTEFIEKLKENEKKLNNSINSINLTLENNPSIIDEKKKKSKNMKDKLKNLMKKKANVFMDKLSSDKEMVKEINKQITIEEKESSDEIMCFFCRNPIKLNSFELPYGKIGLQIEDFFYINSIKSTIRAELDKLNYKDNKNILYKQLENLPFETFSRIISCGHYFHTSCFIEGTSKHNNEFVCPLCLKKQNILIPPLNNFHEKYSFLNSEDINELFDEKTNSTKKQQENNIILFKDIISDFLSKTINKDYENYNTDYISFVDYIYPYYKSYFNFLENIFYIDGTTFHKHQQIDNIQNLVLSLRFIIKNSNYDKSQVINYIKDKIKKLAEGPNNNEYIYNQNDSYMYYVNLLEKILLSLSILFDYEEMEETFKYIIYIFLPYFCFGYFYRDLFIKKASNNLDKTTFKKKLNVDDLKIYLETKNKIIMNYFIGILKKFAITKLITDFHHKNEAIINNFNNLSLEGLLALIEKDSFYKSLSKNKKEINVIDIIYYLPKILNPNDLFHKIFGNIFECNKVFKNIFENIKKYYREKEICSKELIIQFSPIKFGFTYLDKNIFNWVERNIEKKCDVCNIISKYFYVCLICGKRVCKNRHIIEHIKKCGGSNCIFIDMSNMRLYFYTLNFTSKKLFPLYVNDSGNGPDGYEIGNEFNLSNEKLNLAIKNYACNDFH